MRKSLLSLVLLLLFSVSIGVFLTGCGGNSASSQVPVTTKQAANNKTFYDPQLRLLGELTRGGGTAKMVSSEGEGGGLCSWLIKMVVDGLQEGITSGIGDATTGKLFDGLKGNSGTSAQFAAINTQLSNISSQISGLVQQNNTIINIINVNALSTINNANQLAIINTSANISSAWNPGSATYTTIASDAAAGTMSNTDMNTLIGLFLTGQNNSNQALKTSLTNLNNLVLKSGILTSFASQLVQSGGTTTAQGAEYAYTLLQQEFGQILTYQLQAEIMIIEIDNYKDPAGNLGLAQADIGAFKTMIQAECTNFEAAVNFLMINAVDYRNSANYAKESVLMHNYGLAPDDTYNMIFATSRAFVAQLNSSFQTDFGLHGAIVVPNLYRYPASGTGPVSPGPITVKFKSYSSSQLGFANYSSTVTVNKPTTSAGQFPYTAWTPSTATVSAKSYPDGNWLFYEFSAAQNFPAGKYHIILVDGGDNTAPWYHTETLYGNLSVRWYNPNVSVSTSGNGTFSQTTTNTFKFGIFSGRWNWGYNMISMSPWIAPSTINIKLGGGVDPLLGVANPFNGGYVNGAGSPNPKYTNSNIFYSTTSSFGMLVNPFPSWEMDEYYYTMNFPFTISTASVPTNNVGNSVANIYYNNGVNIVANQFKVDYSYVLNDTAAKTSDTITSFMDQSFSMPFDYSIKNPVTISNVLNYKNVKINSADNYNITVAAELNSNYPCVFGGCGQRSGTINLSSDMQVVYTGTYQLPAILN